MSFQPLEGLLGRMSSGGIFGQPQNPGGLLGVAALQDAQKRQQLAMAAALLQASGPSPQKIGLGQALGGSLMAGQQAGDQATQQALQAEMLKRQTQQQNRPMSVGAGDVVWDPQERKVIYSNPSAARGQSPFGTIAPDKFTPESLAKFQETGNYADLKPIGGGYNVGNVNPSDYDPQSVEKFKQTGNFADLQRYETPREQNPYFRDVTRTNPDGSTTQGVFNARSGQYSWPNPVVPPGTKARVDAEGKEIGAAQGSQAAKAPAVASMDYVLNEFEKVLPTTPQGGVMGIGGKIGGVTNYKDATRFDNLREQLSTEVRTAYKIPGEGTLSDQEQQQYGVQLPNRNNPREVNEKIIADLRERTRLRTQTPIGPSQRQPAAQKQTPKKNDINSLLDKYAPKK